MTKKTLAGWNKSLIMSLVLVVAGGSLASAAQSAAGLYSEKCAACHGDKGNGDGPAGQAMTPPPQPFSTGLKGRNDSWIGTVITKGGPAVGMTPAMPPHPNLSKEQVKGLIFYIEGLRS